MCKIVLLGVVLLLEGVWQVRGHRTFQPCGPRLCDVLCHRYKDCSAKTFDEIQLSCQLIKKRHTVIRSCQKSHEEDLEPVGIPAVESHRRNSKDPVKPGKYGVEPVKFANCGHDVPEKCLEEPTYVNQGAVRLRTFCRPGYPVVIEYDCDQKGEEKYKYFSGSREALCGEQGTWTLSAMICIPTSCYTKFVRNSGAKSVLYGGDTHNDKEGRRCQAWIDNKPHKPGVKYTVSGACSGCGSVKDNGNKCRAMDHNSIPWCYTMDTKVPWAYCDIPKCKTERNCARPPILHGATPFKTELIGQKMRVTYRCYTDFKYMGGRSVSTCDMETGVWEWPDLLCGSENCFYFDRDQWRAAVYLGNI